MSEVKPRCKMQGCSRQLYRRDRCRRCYRSAMERNEIPRLRNWQKGKTCRCPGCELESQYKELCPTHYARWMNNGKDESVLVENYLGRNPNFDSDGNPLPCTVSGCEKNSKIKGLCGAHDSMKRRGTAEEELYVPGKKPCPIPGCSLLIGTKARLCVRHNRVKWMYSLDLDKYLEMNLPENYVCGNLACSEREGLHMDHDHDCCNYDTHKTKYSCGKCVRGWLCPSCNKAAGYLRDSPDLARGLADTLARYKTTPPN